MQDAVRTRAQDLIREAVQKIQRLRGTGPNPFDYWIWADETAQLLEAIYGRGSTLVDGFTEIVYERGRTRDQRGAFDNMTLGIHGEWGCRARLNRAEPYLQKLAEEIQGSG
jgi:hypothetical protein